MALAPGTRFGPCKVTGLIGAGGMGEVYRARDTRLDRVVALKILPPGLLPDVSARRRFHTEALALARLTHAQIEYLLSVLEHDGSEAFVMQFVEAMTAGQISDA
jgi:serine/threonine protein kinase